MKRYDYAIAGAGMAAASAIRGIRELDREGSIAVIGEEPDPPYDRPPLSKSLWKGKPLDAIWMDVADAELLLGRSARELKAGSHELVLDDGSAVEYGKLLIATGGRPRLLPFPAGDVQYLRDLGDYRLLRARCEEARRFLVIGGGFIASEIAAALAMNGKEVAMVFPESGIVARILPQELSLHLNDRYRDKGVQVHPGESVASITSRGGVSVARCLSGAELEADAVVAGLGIIPNVELAAGAGLALDDGISVDQNLRASAPDVFAAGDVASYQCAALGRRIRPEHEDNALAMGLTAGRNMAVAAGRGMAGALQDYGRIPYFYSDLFELGYEAIGLPDPACETVIDWRQPYEKGTVYYVEGGRVRGIILWNVRKRVEAARALVAQGGPFRAEELLGRI